MQDALARVRNPALRQGLIFGIILGVVLVGINFISSGLIFIAALTILAAFIAGRRASQETGRLTTGTLAGLWTGLIGTLILSLFALGFLLINIETVRKNAQINANQQHLHSIVSNSQIISTYLIVYLVLLGLGVLFGLMGGALGGIFGSRRAQLPPVEEHKEAMFEPPSTVSAEELPAASETEEPSTTSEVVEPPSETPSEEPTSSMS